MLHESLREKGENKHDGIVSNIFHLELKSRFYERFLIVLHNFHTLKLLGRYFCSFVANNKCYIWE